MPGVRRQGGAAAPRCTIRVRDRNNLTA
jgi:hypothetical protein